jgi:phosphoribosylamine--glycine ligase
VLGVTALGGSLDEARRRAYRGVSAISWPGMQARTDIALEASGGSVSTGDSDSDAAAASAPLRPREVAR